MTTAVLIHHFILLLMLGIVGVSSIGLGALMSKLIQKFTSVSEETLQLPIALLFFIGQVGLSLTMTIASTLLPQPYNLIAVLPILLTGFLVGFKSLDFSKKRRLPNLSLGEWLIALILLAVLGFTFMTAFHKPSEWDEVAYHYPVVKEIARGQLSFPLLQSSPYNSFYLPFMYFYGSLPYGSEAYAALLFLLSGHPSSAHLLYFLNFVFLQGFISFWTKKMFASNTFTTLALSLLLTINHGFIILLATGLIDINVMIYQFLAIALSIWGRQQKSLNLASISLLCMGYALGQKFTTVFLLPLYVPVMLWWFYPLLKSKTEVWKSIFFLSIGGAFWYLKNLILYLNPLYPLYLGHPGLSTDEYQYMVYSLISSIRTAPTLSNFYESLRRTYTAETSTLMLGSLLYLGLCFKKIKLNSTLLLFFGYMVLLYMSNFLIGSQVSRYVLLVPLLLHVMAVLVLNQSRTLTVGVLIACLFMVKASPLQWEVWKYRIKELPQAVAMGYEPHDALKIGCPGDVYTHYLTHLDHSGKMLNFWDAYTSTYYADTGVFYNLGLRPNLNHFSLPPEVKYLYVQKALRADILSNQKGHIYMEPLVRQQLEDKLIGDKQPLFEKDNCALYQL